MAQRGVEASYETVRCWTLKFGRLFAQNFVDAERLQAAVASGRNGRKDPWQADVAVARRR